MLTAMIAAYGGAGVGVWGESQMGTGLPTPLIKVIFDAPISRKKLWRNQQREEEEVRRSYPELRGCMFENTKGENGKG